MILNNSINATIVDDSLTEDPATPNRDKMLALQKETIETLLKLNDLYKQQLTNMM